MNNLNLTFVDVGSGSLAGRKILLTPTTPPYFTASFTSVGDAYTFIANENSTITGSVVAGTYAVSIANPQPATNFFLVVTETGSYVYSGSVSTGSYQCLTIDLINLVKNPFAVKKVSITPALGYPITFNGDVVVLASTSSFTDGTGLVNFPTVVPGPYLVECFGKIDTSFYISIPAWASTGSFAPCWGARDLLIVKPSKAIPVRLNNLDNSYVLTVSASDARYVHAGGTDPTISASYAFTASFALNGGGSGGSSVSASWASQSLSSSVVFLYPTKSNADYYITFAQGVGFQPLFIDTSSIQYNPSGDLLTVPYISCSLIDGTISNASNASHADLADQATVAITSISSVSASWAPPPISASHADFADQASMSFTSTSSSYAETASFASSASWAPKQWNESGSNTLWTNKHIGINTGSVDNFTDILINNSAGHSPLTVKDSVTGQQIIWFINDGTFPSITLTSADGVYSGYMLPYSFGTNTGVSIGSAAHSYISTSYGLGVGTMFPSEKLEVVGNIKCFNLTASNLLGTASYAASASFAPQQWNESGSNLLWTTKRIAINTGSNSFFNLLVNSPIGTTGIALQDSSSGITIAYIMNDGSGNGGMLQVNSIDQTHNAYLGAQQLGIDTGISLTTFQDSFISSSFKFGVGTAFPQAKLHVQGNVSASSFTGSLLGTSSYASTASFITASNVSGRVTFAGSSLTASYLNNTIWDLAPSATPFIKMAGLAYDVQFAGGDLRIDWHLNKLIRGSGSAWSVEGTSSWATNALTASYLSQSIEFPDSVNGYFPYYSSNTLTTSSLFHTDGVSLFADALIVGTASLAKTASFLNGSVTSASYALTASYALNGGSGGSSVSASWASSSLSASILTWMATSSSINNHTSAIVIVSTSTGSYSSAWYDYSATSASIQRAGTIIATFDGNGNFDYTDFSTPSLGGDTSDVVLRVAISASHVRLVSDASIYTWNVKAISRYL